jgi:HK97 family phage prohead protease
VAAWSKTKEKHMSDKANVSGEAATKGRAVIRAFRPGVEVRAAEDGGMPTLHGHFAVFNTPTEINSWMEGNFMERIAPGAFKKTFREQTPKVLFQHGQDPQIGDKPLGTIESLAEDVTGAAYEVRMLDTAYNRELLPGLEAGLYGASFRFRVMREEVVDKPGVSADNPNGLPERTIKEAQVMEFGPVTFPAYAEATAGVRSLTDRFLFDAIERDPQRAQELIRGDVLRMDTEDLMPLNQMMMCATDYIAAQDPAVEQPMIDKMEEVITILHDLQHHEVTEDEGMEPADEGMNAGRNTRTLTTSTPLFTGTQADKPAPPLHGTSEPKRREPIYGLTREEIPSWQL